MGKSETELTAWYTKKEVLAGPGEATALGNLAAQMIAGIIACSLNTAGQRPVMVKSDYIISLPAVHGNGNPFETLQSRIRADDCGRGA